MTLNLKQPGSREVFADLVRQADVVVENFTPGTLDRLGVGYEFARAQNPRIVYCSISGYGADHATTGSGKAMDSIIQALSGLMMTSGAPAEPPVRVGVPVADYAHRFSPSSEFSRRFGSAMPPVSAGMSTSRCSGA